MDVENRAFAANGPGIYELTGDTDAGTAIHSGVLMHNSDFGAPHQKRFRRGYLGISGGSPVMVLETEDGGRLAYTIDNNGKAVFSHEQKSKKWTLTFICGFCLSSSNSEEIVVHVQARSS